MKILILEGLHGNNKGKKCQWRLKYTNLKVGNLVTLDCHDWKIIEVIGESKEVKKLSRPYFETKVVKVKKDKCIHKTVTCKCDMCGTILIHGIKPKRREGRNKLVYDKKSKTIVNVSKGNWVNGENLDKIKFPCFCSFKSEKYLGEETKGKMESHNGIIHINGGDFYELFCIDKQDKWDFIDSCTILKNLISSYDIHILKGKIIIYKEE